MDSFQKHRAVLCFLMEGGGGREKNSDSREQTFNNRKSVQVTSCALVVLCEALKGCWWVGSDVSWGQQEMSTRLLSEEDSIP